MRQRAIELAAVCAVGAGALAFGSVYPWAHRPLAVLCAAIGVAGLIKFYGRPGTPIPILAAAALVCAAIGMQLIPLAPGVLDAISPQTLPVIRRFQLGYATATSAWHPISIFPGDTWSALGLAIAMTVFLAGLTRTFSAVGVRITANGLVVVAVILAVVGIVQQPLYEGKVLGFWTPEQRAAQPFGPFINKNHFAGWMLMVCPIILALLFEKASRAMAHVRPTVRDRLLWLSSRDASTLVLLATSAGVAGLALLMTMSRSGIVAFLASILVAGFTMRSRSSGIRPLMAAALLIVLGVMVVVWANPTAIWDRFAETSAMQMNSRLGAWSDAWGIARQFPAAGVGLGTYTYAMLFFQRHALELHYAQAHNDYLQLMAEGGVLVCLPFGLLGIAFVRTAARRLREPSASATSWWVRRGAITGLLGIGLQEAMDFSLQMPANAMLLVVLCAIAIHTEPSRRSATRGGGL